VFSGLPGLLCSTLTHIDASAEFRLRRGGPEKLGGRFEHLPRLGKFKSY
jgi:hypothetical protein